MALSNQQLTPAKTLTDLMTRLTDLLTWNGCECSLTTLDRGTFDTRHPKAYFITHSLPASL